MVFNFKKTAEYVELGEGRERFPYKCPAGKLTIGVGFNLEDVGLYNEEIDFILENRIHKAREALMEFEWFRGLCFSRKMVLIDMLYNLGLPRLLTFKRMIEALEQWDYERAGDEILDSKYAKQVGIRATRNARIMKTGDY